MVEGPLSGLRSSCWSCFSGYSLRKNGESDSYEGAKVQAYNGKNTAYISNISIAVLHQIRRSSLHNNIFVMKIINITALLQLLFSFRGLLIIKIGRIVKVDAIILHL